ncbi:glycosyltransferase family 4 protein [Candidatus Uabimicrobium sp. HlEnr_7]|uniref:glycosyltransferase family 4 protein n=1 Tax=Candidatus Uabimicrobium helgolandensis TaxID=3095367 RepID=UPI00355796CF
MHIMWINELVDFTGGCEQYIFQTAQNLQKNGYKNTILYDVDSDISPAFLKVFDGAYPMVDIARQIKEAKPDILYIHRLAEKKIQTFLKSGVPTVRFFHDHKLFCLREHKYRTFSQQTCKQPIGLRCYPCLGFVHRDSNPFGVKFKTLGSLKREQRLNHKVSFSVVASGYMKSHLIAHGFSTDRIKVIPLYARPPQKEQHFTRDTQTLLFVGQLVRGKGIDILLRALTLLKSKPQLLIIGDGRQKTMFEKLSQELGLSEQVRFLGKKSTVEEYYQKCTCVVLPSRTPETFALIGPEAMRYQTPVVACDVGGISDWLRHEHTGLLVPPNDAKKLSEALDVILNDKSMREKMGQEAQKDYLEKYTPQQHTKALMSFFEACK